jgi:hypothetical protein
MDGVIDLLYHLPLEVWLEAPSPILKKLHFTLQARRLNKDGIIYLDDLLNYLFKSAMVLNEEKNLCTWIFEHEDVLGYDHQVVVTLVNKIVPFDKELTVKTLEKLLSDDDASLDWCENKFFKDVETLIRSFIDDIESVRELYPLLQSLISFCLKYDCKALG